MASSISSDEQPEWDNWKWRLCSLRKDTITVYIVIKRIFHGVMDWTRGKSCWTWNNLQQSPDKRSSRGFDFPFSQKWPHDWVFFLPLNFNWSLYNSTFSTRLLRMTFSFYAALIRYVAKPDVVHARRWKIKRIFRGVMVRIGKVEPEGWPVRSGPSFSEVQITGLPKGSTFPILTNDPVID